MKCIIIGIVVIPTNIDHDINELFSKLNIREGTYLKIYIFAN